MRGTLCLVLIAAPFGFAQEKKPAPGPAPKILYPIPLFARPGQKSKIVLRGKNLDTVKEVIASDPAVKVKLLTTRKTPPGNNRPGEREGPSELEVELDVPKDVKPGFTLIAKGESGDSPAYVLPFPPDFPRIAEKEDNGGFRTVQPVPFPAFIEGKIGNDKDTDVFRFDGKAGQRIEVELLAARHGSPVDGFLTVYDSEGRVLASTDDGPNSMDPILTLTLPREGTYFVSVIDANDLGGGLYGYGLVLRSAKEAR